ncbi:four helix bundle protein [uncultured Imperialibacter sp.]|uniref:four helix bundle protein n=1 Tax=uncultured Imperialibacter sp. TaxID=1672639 RepID=UPI0030DBD618
MANLKSFEELECWKAGKELRVFVSKLAKRFPMDERYALTSQIKRSSRSVTNNIAEGYGRFHFQENIQFCRQGRGSLYETLDHLLIAKEEEYIDEPDLIAGRQLIEKTTTILNGYINYLSEAKKKSL